jgi:hypothetical protein
VRRTSKAEDPRRKRLGAPVTAPTGRVPAWAARFTYLPRETPVGEVVDEELGRITAAESRAALDRAELSQPRHEQPPPRRDPQCEEEAIRAERLERFARTTRRQFAPSREAAAAALGERARRVQPRARVGAVGTADEAGTPGEQARMGTNRRRAAPILPVRAAPPVANPAWLAGFRPMGGTGLEPVTPSLSRRHPRSRALAPVTSFSGLCRDFTLHKWVELATVCTLCFRLVVARGSSACASHAPTRRGNEPANVHHRSDQPCPLTLALSHSLHHI